MITDISNDAQYQTVIKSKVAILFKHSTSCFLSENAYREVRSFAESHPEVPVYLIKVIEHRELSDRLAEFFQIRHESPQIIVIRNGLAERNFSHQRITQSAIESSM